MKLTALNCPNCGAPYNPVNIRCDYCGSFIIMSNENQYNVPPQVVERIEREGDNCPGIYVFGTLLGKGEAPLRLGSANYYKNSFVNVGGKVLLTKRSLQFSTHTFMQSKDTVVIPLDSIIKAEYDRSNIGISDQISVYTSEKRHKFVVYGGREWVNMIMSAKLSRNSGAPAPVSQAQRYPQPQSCPAPQGYPAADYTEELLRLKRLLDAGVITQEEFALKKRQILNI